MSKIDSIIADLKWWEEKNKYKDADVEYPLDFKHEMVESVQQGEMLEIQND